MVNAQDRKIFDELIRLFHKERTSIERPDQLILKIGKFFLGTPYAAGTLEVKCAEHLIVNLREYDCFTLVENVVALSKLIGSRRKSFFSFRKFLQQIRYRQGHIQSYSSRLHYFSDWIQDNHKKRILQDVTAEVGGKPFKKDLSFMTTHPHLYPRLRDPAEFRRMKSHERRISKTSLFFIPKKAVKRSERQFHDGDLVAVTTNKEGLDVEHVGIAVRVKNRVHLLHASSTTDKVVLSREPLPRYLMQRKTCSGIMVARVLL